MRKMKAGNEGFCFGYLTFFLFFQSCEFPYNSYQDKRNDFLVVVLKIAIIQVLHVLQYDLYKSNYVTVIFKSLGQLIVNSDHA